MKSKPLLLFFFVLWWFIGLIGLFIYYFSARLVFLCFVGRRVFLFFKAASIYHLSIYPFDIPSHKIIYTRLFLLGAWTAGQSRNESRPSKRHNASVRTATMYLCLFQPNKSKYNCVSALEPRRKGADASAPQIGSGKASRLFISYFLFSCLRPLPVMLLAAVRAAPLAPRAAGSIGGNVRTLESAHVCRQGRARVVCVFGKQRRRIAVWSDWEFRPTRLLSQFGNQIFGRSRSFDWVMKGAAGRRDAATMSWKSLFPAWFPRRSGLAAVIVSCIAGVARSVAGAILEGSPLGLLSLPLLLFLSAKMFL